jgi:hypothetical protein
MAHAQAVVRAAHGRNRLAAMKPVPIAAIGIAMTAIASPAGAQNYPWCSNFADGAGTNCGFPTLQQCQTTIAGSGGYCDHNNFYKPSTVAGAAPPAARKPRKGLPPIHPDRNAPPTRSTP